MKITLDLRGGAYGTESIAHAINKNIDAQERAIDGNVRVCDITPLRDTLWILKLIKEKASKNNV